MVFTLVTFVHLQSVMLWSWPAQKVGVIVVTHGSFVPKAASEL